MSKQISVSTVLYTVPDAGQEYSLITLEVNVPYFVWVEILTHKRFARNASSNRAMPVSKNIQELGYFKPDKFYFKGKGMNSGEPIDEFSPLDLYVNSVWSNVWDYCSKAAINLEENGITKEQASRVLPTFKMMKGIVTATYSAWMAFLKLRDSKDADNAMQDLAKKVRLHVETPPILLDSYSNNHFPYKGNVVIDRPDKFYILAGRLARISYGEAGPKQEEKDMELGKRLYTSGHFSPFEHLAIWEKNPIVNALCSRTDDVKDGYGWSNARGYLEDYGVPPLTNTEKVV